MRPAKDDPRPGRGHEGGEDRFGRVVRIIVGPRVGRARTIGGAIDLGGVEDVGGAGDEAGARLARCGITFRIRRQVLVEDDGSALLGLADLGAE